MLQQTQVRLLVLLAVLLTTAPASATKGPQVVPQMAGTYDGVHRDWRDSVTLKADGSYARGNGDPGTWTFDGKTLVLKWKHWGPEPVNFKSRGVYAASDNHFTLKQRNLADASAVVGTWDAVHPDWRDSVTINADGTYSRGSGDPGVWFFDGKTLDLFWLNWGQEPVELKGDGKLASSNGKFHLTRRGGPVAVAPPPPPAPPIPAPPPPRPPPPPAQPEHHDRFAGDQVLGQWAWKFVNDNSMWGPDTADFHADGTITFERDHATSHWQRNDAIISVKLASGDTLDLKRVDHDTMEGTMSSGYAMRPTRLGAKPAPEAAVAPPPPPPPAVAPPPVAPPPVAPPPSLPSAANASRLIQTDKAVYRVGEPVVVTYFGTPGGSTDWTNVVPAAQATDEWGDWSYNSGADGSRTVKNLKPGTYEARAYFNGSTNLEDKVTFTVAR